LALTLRHLRRRRRDEENMEEFEVKRGMLTTGEWCDPVSKISHNMKKKT